MAELHVQPKRKSNWWIWVVVLLIIIAGCVYYYLNYYKKGENLNTNASTNTSSLIRTNIATPFANGLTIIRI